MCRSDGLLKNSFLRDVLVHCFDIMCFCIILGTMHFGNRFMFTLLNTKITLQPGKYIVMIDPVWNSTVQNDEMYREVMLDIYGPEGVMLS